MCTFPQGPWWYSSIRDCTWGPAVLYLHIWTASNTWEFITPGWSLATTESARAWKPSLTALSHKIQGVICITQLQVKPRASLVATSLFGFFLFYVLLPSLLWFSPERILNKSLELNLSSQGLPLRTQPKIGTCFSCVSCNKKRMPR